MKIYLLLILLSTIFTQDDGIKKDQDGVNPFSLKGFKVGLDIGGELEYSVDGSGLSDDMETSVSFAMEFFTSNNNLEVGMEYLNEADFDDWPASVSHISFYGLYNLFKDSDINLKAKFGYSTLDFDINNSSYYYYSQNIDSDGGIMYGIQLELSNGIHLSYTIHNGQYSIDTDYYYDDYPTADTKTSRFTISYLFKI